MKPRQKYASNQPIIDTLPYASGKSDKTYLFIDALITCNVLYRMKNIGSSQDQHKDILAELPLVKHAFVNAREFQSMPKPLLNMNTSAGRYSNDKSLFDTFNHSDFTANQDHDYFNYVKDYNTLKKRSGKKEQTSALQSNRQMDLLIHQFLSNATPPTTTHKRDEAQKGHSKGKVEKVEIDLDAFHIAKSSNKSPTHKEAAAEQRKSSITPRFSHLNQAKNSSRKNINSKQRMSAGKKSIEIVKVTNLAAKQQKGKPLVAKEKFTIAKNNQKKRQICKMSQIIQQKSIKGIKSAEKQHFNPYSRQEEKKSQIKIEGEEESSTNSKKPIKIQIQIPLELSLKGLMEEQKGEQAKIKQLEEQGHEIIKDISHKVMTMLQKSKQASRPSK